MGTVVVTHQELDWALSRLRSEFQAQLEQYQRDNASRFVEFAQAVVHQLEEKENYLMSLVAVSQDQIDQIKASIIALTAIATTLGADNKALSDLVTGLRSQLAAAIAAGTPLPVADLSDAIASIDAVTGTLSGIDQSDVDAAAPPAITTTPVPAAPPPPAAAPAASAPADGTSVGTPAPAAPNAGDPTSATGADHSDPVPGSTDAASGAADGSGSDSGAAAGTGAAGSTGTGS